MLDDFALPYEQDFTKIRQQIDQLKLSSSSSSILLSGDNKKLANDSHINKSFLIKILSNQLDTVKIENLKKQHLRVSSNRHEIVVLKQWLDFMIFKIYKEDHISSQDILQKTQLIFHSCFHELLKQISVDCSSRACLLQKLWTNQNEVFLKLIEDEQRNRLKHEQDYLNEITRVHKMYSTQISHLESSLLSTNQTRTHLDKRCAILTKNVKYLKKNNKQVSGLVKKMKEEGNCEKKKNEDLELLSTELQKQLINLSTHKNMPHFSHSIQSSHNLRHNPHLLLSKKQASTQTHIDTNKNKECFPSTVQSNKDTITDLQSQHSFKVIDGSPVIVLDAIVGQSAVFQHGSGSELVILEKQLSFNNNQTNCLSAQGGRERDQDDSRLDNEDEDEDDDYLNMSMIVQDKSIDAQDQQRHFSAEIEVQTTLKMNEITVKSDVHQTCISIQVDSNTFKELGIFLADKEVQTTMLDPEYEESLKGVDILGLEKVLDNLMKAEDSYEKTIEKYNPPLDVRKALYGYLKSLNKSQEEIKNLLRNEIGLKEKYHNETMELKLLKKEDEMTCEDLQQTNDLLTLSNESMKKDNECLNNTVSTLERRLRYMTGNLEKFQSMQSQLYAETSKLALNIQRSSIMKTLVDSVNSGCEFSPLDLANLRQRLSIDESSPSIQITQIQSSPRRLTVSPALNIREIPLQTSQALQKIKKVVQNLVDLDLNSKKSRGLSDASINSNSDSDSEEKKQNIPFLKNVQTPILPRNSATSTTRTSVFKFNQPSREYTLITFFLFINLQKRKTTDFERKRVRLSVSNVGISMVLLGKMQKRINMKLESAKMTMTKKNVCKYITSIYQERHKNDKTKIDPFHLVCYDYFLSLFGLKRVAESKLMQFYEGIYYFKQKSTRIKLFGQFLQLYDDRNADELDYYLTIVKSLEEDTPPFVHTQLPSNEVVFCLFDKVTGILRKQEEGRHEMNTEEWISSMEKNKVTVKVMNNTTVNLIDVDVAMERVIEGYSKIKQTNKHLDQVFSAADLDKDGLICFYEFMCLFKYIEEKDGECLFQVEQIFFASCDVLNSDTGEKSLSAEKFVSVCTQRRFFREDKVKLFVEKKRDCASQEDLKSKTKDIMKLIKMRLYQAGSFTTFFAKTIHNLTKTIKTSSTLTQSVLIAYVILNEESKQALLKSLIKDCLPEEFTCIVDTFTNHTGDPYDESYPVEYTTHLIQHI